MDIDLKTIRELLAIVGNTDITELTIESGDQCITVKKAPANTNVIQHISGDAGSSQPAMPLAIAPPPKPATAEHKAEPAKQSAADSHDNVSNGHIQITSPMVGTFYSSPSPKAPPFVRIGDHVNVGQTVCIIEAMKLMNDMPSEVQGKIVKVLAENGTTVEYGQALFLVDPKG